MSNVRVKSFISLFTAIEKVTFVDLRMVILTLICHHKMTHLTKSTKIPPTKITRPINGTMLEMLDAVWTTELMTFILLFRSSKISL